jgi:hypothetical protein
MNPFTNFLHQWSQNSSLGKFIHYWDRLEHVVVGVYRDKMAIEEAREEFAEVWPWLGEQYGQWEEDLRPFWTKTRAGGQPTTQDPFRLLLAFDKPEDILGDWSAMQHLPAAREALNQFVLSQS